MPINKYFLKGSETTQLIMLSPDDNKMSDKGKNFHDCFPDWTIYKKDPDIRDKFTDPTIRFQYWPYPIAIINGYCQLFMKCMPHYKN